jgi:hypothetical protein
MLNILTGEVYTDSLRDRDNGGPECVNYMSFEFRLTCNIIAVMTL